MNMNRSKLRGMLCALCVMLLLGTASAAAQITIAPLSLNLASSDASFECEIGALTSPTVTASGTLSAAPLSSIVALNVKAPSSLTEVMVSDVTMWPNPATDRIFIKSGTPIASYSISDMSGRCVISGGKGGQEEEAVAILSLAPGYYVLEVVATDGTKFTGKFIKK